MGVALTRAQIVLVVVVTFATSHPTMIPPEGNPGMSVEVRVRCTPSVRTTVTGKGTVRHTLD
jgi:hypothetical protein